jgi:hypothetical protein
MFNRTKLNIDAVLPSQIYYDPTLKRYRYKGGGKNQPIRGTFVSRSDALKLQKDYLMEAKARFLALTPRIMAGEIGVYKEAGELLKSIHMSNAVLAANGIDKLTDRDLGTIGSILKKQYYSGKGDDGKSYGLKHLFNEVRSGSVSAAQLKNRLAMYAEAGEISGSVVKQNQAYSNGLTAMRRIDSGDDAECEDCVRYAAAGWQLIGSLPIPKTQCKCRSNCRCRVIYARGEDVVLGS